jgi:tetratricopeptide (TPR) repeat protein
MDKTQLIEKLQAAVANKDFVQLEALLEQASTEHTEAAFTHYFKGEYQLLMNDPDTAIAFFEKAVELDQNYDYQLSLAYAKLQANRDEEAKVIFDQLLSENPKNAELQFAVAMYHSGQMDDEAALKHLDEALKLNADLDDAREMRAFIYKMSAQTDKALADYNALIEADPANPSLRFQRIELLKTKKDKEGVIADYNALITADPDDVEYRVGLGEYYVSIGEFKEGEYCFSDVLDIEKSVGILSSYPYKKRGMALLRQGSYYKAMDDFKEAMKLEEEDAEGYLLMAEALDALNEIPKAINYLNIGLDLAFDQRWSLYEKLGALYLKQEKWLEAEKAFEGMTRDLAGKAEGYYQLGLLYVRQGDLESAYEALQEADDNLHERAEEMLHLHCAQFMAANKRAAELELMAEYEDEFENNAASPTLKQAFGKLWKLDEKATQDKNAILAELPAEMKTVLLEAFQTMMVNISPQGLLIFNYKKEDTRALYSIESEAANQVEVQTQPFESGAAETLSFKVSGDHFVLCGIGEGDASLDLYFKATTAASLPANIKADYQAKQADGKMEFLGEAVQL